MKRKCETCADTECGYNNKTYSKESLAHEIACLRYDRISWKPKEKEKDRESIKDHCINLFLSGLASCYGVGILLSGFVDGNYILASLGGLMTMIGFMFFGIIVKDGFKKRRK